MGTSVDPAEQSAYNAFNNQAVVDTKIQLGEEFDQKYPNSRYEEQVDTSLSFLYFNKGDYAKFYAACDRVLAKDPKSVPVLELVGWVIPRNYNALDPASTAKLDQAEKYEKRALGEIAAMKKPRPVTPSEFQNSKSGLEWRAHSGLGTIYFRRKDYAESAAELQVAIKQQGTGPDPADLYVLGVDLEHLGHMTQAADAFAQCSVATGGMQEQCQKAYEAASHAAVESVEQKAYDAFNDAPNAKTQIQLGEKFDQSYPSSQYREHVDSTLLSLYEGEPDWTKFYATANTILTKDPDNVPVLALVGWVIPRHYEATASGGSDRLAEAEKYEKHALELIATMQKPADLSEDQFELAKEDAASRAHGGLGTTDFRLGDYAGAAAELQLATANDSQKDPWDFYVLGTALHKLKRDPEAIQAFSNCAAVSGYLQEQCVRDVAAVSSALSAPPTAAQLTAVAAKSPAPAVSQPAASDLPILTAQGTAPAIRAETVVVPVRVVVRDNKGRAVAELKKEDFKLYQDGKQQDIANFTAVSRSRAATGGATNSATATSVSSAPTLFSSVNVSPASAPESRFIALFFDDAHLYFADIAQTRTAAEKYISTLRPTDRVAIVTTSGQGESQFTSDREKLHAALEKLQQHPFPGGPSATAGVFPCPPPMTYVEAYAITSGGAMSNTILGIAAADIANCVHAPGDFTGQARGTAEQAHVADQEAIDAIFEKLKTEIRRMSVLPGDRAVVLVSPGFIYGGHEQTFADLTNLAIRSNVVVNTLDAKGVYGTSPRDRSGMPIDKWDPDRFMKFGYNHAMEDAVLEDLADGTGGLFIHFNNDFLGSMREMSEAPEAYYLLGYAPQNLQPDGKFHVLKVSLSSGAHGNVQARRGFFAPSHLETPEEAAKREVDDLMFSDEVHHDLPVKLERSLTRGTSGVPQIGVKAHVDASQLHFVKAGETNQENLTVVAALFDSDGNYVTGTQKVDQMNLDDTTLAQLEKTGFYIELDLSAKPGNYVLRMVACDSNDGHISAENANVTIPF